MEIICFADKNLYPQNIYAPSSPMTRYFNLVFSTTETSLAYILTPIKWGTLNLVAVTGQEGNANCF